MNSDMIVVFAAVFTAMVGVFIAISGSRGKSNSDESMGE